MLSFHMFVATPPRRSLDSFSGLTPIPCPLSPKSFPCHTSAKSPVSPSIATLPKMRVSNPCVCHTYDTPRGASQKLLTRNTWKHFPPVEQSQPSPGCFSLPVTSHQPRVALFLCFNFQSETPTRSGGKIPTRSEISTVPATPPLPRAHRNARLVSSPSTFNCQLLTCSSLSIESKRSHMTDQPPSDRFKSEMPQIPGVSGPGSRSSAASNPAAKLVIGLLAVLLVVFLGARWALRPKRAVHSAVQQPQIEVPSPAPDPSTLLPHATDTEPGIANVAEMARPWSLKEFYIRNPLSGENIPAVLVRLPAASASQASSYWAFAKNSPYGNCQLEYITDLNKLKNDYGFRAAKHPMVGNPCSRTVFDPLKLTNLPGSVWVRGAIVQGSDLRPPLGIEIKVEGRKILAVRAE